MTRPVDLVSIQSPTVIQPPNKMSFKPTTALQNPRYDKEFALNVSYQPILSGILSCSVGTRNEGIPAGWAAHIHPEGALYFTNEALKICTDTRVDVPDSYEALHHAIEQFGQMLTNLNFILPDDHELYIHFDAMQQCCRYYLVDHSRQMQYWLHDVNSYDLELPMATSTNHLGHILQEHYWTHVEYFPHRPVTMKLHAELLGILRHARIDLMTSETCTFPFDADQCAQFAAIVNEGTSSQNQYMTCVIARIWSSVARHRFDHFYGEEYARLGRDQKRIMPKQITQTIFIKLFYAMTFGFPEMVENEVNSLLTDNLVYIIHWKKFAQRITKEWTDATYLSLGLLIVNGTLLSVCWSSLSMVPALASISLSVAGTYTGLALQTKHGNFETMNCTAAANHLGLVEHSRYGYAPISVLYSLPKALSCWAVILLFVEIMDIAIERMGWLVGVIPAAMLILYGIFVLFHILSSKARRFMQNPNLTWNVYNTV